MTDDDEKIWQEAVADVKKISSEIVPDKQKRKPKPKHEVVIPFVSRDGFEDELVLADFHNVDNATAKRIKRTQYEVEAVLDLHGATVNTAYDKVRNFIFESYHQKKRCVMIITGKGYKPENEDIFSSRGILREKVPEWLNAFDIRPLILSISNPPAKMGGEGALYIILRRHRL